MATETKYTSIAIIFKSKGIVARDVTDRAPEHTYLNMAGILEREEHSLSTRYGTTLITRDPDGTPAGTNYLLPLAPITLARLRSLGGLTYRYVGLSNGDLYRRAGDTQGAYTRITGGLSGNRFSTLVNTCFQSAQPYLFIYDSASMIKDSGTGVPTGIGIFPPVLPVIATRYAPQVLPIDSFQASSGYAPSGMSLVGISTIATVAGTSGTSQLSSNYFQYIDNTGSYATATDGMMATSNGLADGALRVKFNSFGPNSTYDIVALNNAYAVTDSFKFQAVTFSIASSTTGYIGKTQAFNLGAYNPADLIVLVMKVSNPSAVQEIRVMFDVGGSGFAANYYYKSVVPASYQSAISLPQTNDPISAVIGEVFGRAGGAVNLAQMGNKQILPADDPVLPQIQPSQMSSGDGAWSVIYLQKGDFLPVGNADTTGKDWSAITGWRIQVTTTAQGSTTIGFNGLYVQGGASNGPSSYGGLGYDFRYVYYNKNTGTPSNPSMAAQFSVTPRNPGGSSTLVVMRQAINLLGQYSADPQVTHVKIYVRGGLYGSNWFYADQIPNIVGSGFFNYKYTLSDSALAQGNVLGLTNDVPVTSTLQNPISTTNVNPINPFPNSTNTPSFATCTTADVTAVFVANQIVVIGTPNNLEQVFVVTGGVGTFSAYFMLPHAAGDPVQAFSRPAQPCNLAASGYGQTWLAGDVNNPHLLYYTPKGFPENCPPQNAIPSPGGPNDPITAVINFKDAIYVRTLSTWYKVFPGSPPYMVGTGSKHGSPASFDWCITESEVWYQSWDGIRSFRGADGPYRSLIIEWLYRGNTTTPIPVVDTSKLSQVISAFKNNTAIFVYPGKDGSNHTLTYHTQYNRWHNDNINITAMLLEDDTHQLLYALPVTAGAQSGWGIVYTDNTKDYDDGGWVAGALTHTPIPVNLQTPYFDQEAPNNQKQYNDLTIDANPRGQTLTVQLKFDDDNGEVAPITLGQLTGTIRDKFQFQLNSGLGQQAYRASLVITGSVTTAPSLYQADIHAALLAENRASYDSYWVKFGTDESKMAKQAFIDYTATLPVTVSLYADGSANPYYTVTLPANPNRAEVPTRLRFPALKMRMYRVVILLTGLMPVDDSFALWNPIQVDTKPVAGSGAKGYSRSELPSS